MGMNVKCKTCGAIEVNVAATPKKCSAPGCKGRSFAPHIDQVTKASQTLPGGTDGNYYLIGEVQHKPVYARLNRTKIAALKAGANFPFDIYETQMRKGIIGGKATGKGGVKHEPYGYVIKVTIAQGAASGADNVISPLATVSTNGEKMFLDFDQLTSRH